MRKTLKYLLWLLGFIVSGGGIFVIWGLTPAKPMPEVFDRLLSEEMAGTGSEKWLTFVPDGGPPKTGLILYPGARVDFRAYALTAQAIADHGYLVFLVRMPLNLAVFDPGIAEEVISTNPDITKWAVGGHSLGGAMAANFVFQHPGMVSGLVLWAAYPASSNDLSTFDINVVSISGTRDGLTTPEKIAASLPLLPKDTIWLAIEGGNHAQFGWYGDQAGDNDATISREIQQEQIVQATVELLGSLR